MCLFLYLHYWSLQNFPVMITTLILHRFWCVLILYMSDGTIMNNRFLRNFHSSSIYRQTFFQKSAERQSQYFLYFVMFEMFDPGAWTEFEQSLFTLKVLARNLLRASRQRNIFIFSFSWLTWGLNCTRLWRIFLQSQKLQIINLAVQV